MFRGCIYNIFRGCTYVKDVKDVSALGNIHTLNLNNPYMMNVSMLTNVNIKYTYH